MATNESTPTNVSTTYTQPTSKPTAKVAAVGAAGLIIGAIVTILTVSGVTIPEGLPEQAENAVAAVIVLITFGQAVITFAAGYLKKSNTKQ